MPGLATTQPLIHEVSNYTRSGLKNGPLRDFGVAFEAVILQPRGERT
jgi:hypothetical protein